MKKKALNPEAGKMKHCHFALARAKTPGESFLFLLSRNGIQDVICLLSYIPLYKV